ncbi:MAG: pitrilysin family protein, partial [Pseudomonadota bacterium]
AAAPIQKVVSPGGIEAWLVEEQAIPIISIEIQFEGGAVLDPAGKEGVSNLLAGLLEEGAGDLDAVGFAEAADALAARYGFGSGRESFSVSAAMLAENRDASVDLLRLALTAPRFDEEPVTRVKRQIVSGLRSSETNPNAIASKAFNAAAFPGDAYGRVADGTVESVSALTVEDLNEARQTQLNVATAKIGVVGAITAEELGPLLDRLLGDLPNEPRESLAPVEFSAPPGVTVIDLDIPQSVAMFGHEGILRDDPDFIPAYVLNYVFGGGGFSSRLTVEVREKRGLSYSVYSYLLPMDRAGMIVGGVATSNEQMAKSIEVIQDEWRKIAEEGITEAELERAKRYLTGAYALRFDSNAKIANILVGLQAAGLPIDYPETRNALVEAVTMEDIKRVAARLMKPEELSIVVVGRPVGLNVSD